MRAERLRAVSAEATRLRAAGDSADARAVVAHALRADSADHGGRRYWGKAFTRASAGDGVAAWLAFRLATFRLEDGDDAGALGAFARLSHDVVPTLPDSLQLEADRAVVYMVTRDGVAGLTAGQRARMLSTLDLIQRRADRRGLTGVARRAAECELWIRNAMAEGDAVDSLCVVGETDAACEAPKADRLAMWVAGVLTALLALSLVWGMGQKSRADVAVGAFHRLAE